jgi:hypothetical protein
MAGMFDWLGGRKSAGRDDAAADASGDSYAQLSARLGDYPPDTPRHRGDPRTLTPEQRAENLAQFLDRDGDRIATVVAWLAREGLDAATVLQGDEAALAEGRRIDEWLGRWVPQRPMDAVRGDAEPNPPFARWFASDRAGADLAFSFISDLSRLNAAAIRAADPVFAWATVGDDIARATRTDQDGRPTNEPSSEQGHICLVRDLHDGSVPVVLDVPVAVLGLVHQRMSPMGLPVQESFPVGLEAARAGAYHRR